MQSRFKERVPDLRGQPAAAYGVALVLGCTAVLLRAAMSPHLAGSTFAFAYSAVIVTGYVAGMAPAVIAAAIGAIGAAFPVPPLESLWIDSWQDWFAVALYLLTSTFIAFGFDRLRQSADANRGLAESRRLLLQELQHRVKNHIQLVSALLSLQARATRNPELAVGLANARRRIMAVGSAYSNLYAPGATVEFGEHLRRITRELEEAFSRPGLKIEVNSVEAHLGMDLVVPLTLIAGELITNTFKHAEIRPDAPPVRIEFAMDTPKNYRLAVIDHGTLPEDFALAGHAGLGLKIADQLSRQLGGTLGFERKPVMFWVTFPNPVARS